MSRSPTKKPVYKPAVWRLIQAGPSDGAMNMAIDEALMKSVEAGESRPVLRIYRWEPTCLSIGRDQEWAIVDPENCQERGWDIVRRPTFGRAILHEADLSYAVCIPLSDGRVQGDSEESYKKLVEGLLSSLNKLGLQPNRTRPYYNDGGAPGPVGFDGPAETDFDVSIGQRKIINSGQWQTGKTLLQQGSFPLVGDVSKIAEGLWFDYPGQRTATELRLGYRATTLELMIGRDVPFEEAAAVFGEGFSEALNIRFEPSMLTEKETALVQRLKIEKYTSEEWLQGW